MLGSRIFILSLLLYVEGGFCSICTTAFTEKHICAVRGSSVVFLCSCSRSDRGKANKFTWGHKSLHSTKGQKMIGPNLKVFGRFEYIGDRDRNCSMKINQVERKDAGTYVLIVNDKIRVKQKLHVADLNILVSNSNQDKPIREGNSVKLTCINGCDDDGPSSAFLWFKNQEPINEGKVLFLRNISSAQSGNYSCSLKTQTGTTSGVRLVDVEYGPKNTSVVVRSSAGRDANSSVALICSSDAHPSELNYTWFKMADGQIMKVGHQHVLLPDDGGLYLCSVTNRHGSQNATVFVLKMKPYWATFTRDMLLIVAVFLIAITVIAACSLQKRRKRAPEAEYEKEPQNEDYVNRLMCSGSQPQDQCPETGGEAVDVVYSTVNFYRRRENNMERRDSEGEHVIYSTVCRNHF